jgi:hypothetical protein
LPPAHSRLASNPRHEPRRNGRTRARPGSQRTQCNQHNPVGRIPTFLAEAQPRIHETAGCPQRQRRPRHPVRSLRARRASSPPHPRTRQCLRRARAWFGGSYPLARLDEPHPEMELNTLGQPLGCGLRLRSARTQPQDVAGPRDGVSSPSHRAGSYGCQRLCRPLLRRPSADLLVEPTLTPVPNDVPNSAT